MPTLSFDAFTRKIIVAAPVEQLYHSWATAEGIRTWFLKTASYTGPDGKQRPADQPFRAGDDYLWEWYNWDGQEKGKILEANGRNLLRFSFAGTCKVQVSLEAFGGETLVTLRQYDIPTDEKSKLEIHVGCSNGWTFWLANLKACLEHGLVLNDKAHELSKLPLASYEFVNI